MPLLPWRTHKGLWPALASHLLALNPHLNLLAILIYSDWMACSYLSVSQRSPAGDQGLPPSYSPRDVLALALSQGTLDELPMILTRAAHDPNTPVHNIAQIMASLERVGVDFTGARAALVNGTSRHCARCHKTYRDRENGPNACIIYHDAADGWQDPGDLDASCACPCQGIVAAFNVTLVDKSECYRGWHTDDPAQVDYVSSSAISCKDNNCNTPSKPNAA